MNGKTAKLLRAIIADERKRMVAQGTGFKSNPKNFTKAFLMKGSHRERGERRRRVRSQLFRGVEITL